MKAKVIKLLLTIICLSSSISISATHFTVDGISYSVLSFDDLTCGVARGGYTGDIVIPEKVTYDGKTFTVTSISPIAFRRCSKLTSVTIPKSVIEIGDETFSGCYSLTNVNIPNSVTSIGYGAFYECSSLTSVTIPNSVTSIGHGAFCDCSSLTSMTIPESVKEIGNAAFSGCSSLTDINVDAGNTVYISLNGVLYNKEKTFLMAYPPCKEGTSYSIPETVTSIGNYAFYYCLGLTNLTIPNSVASIDAYAFEGCSGLTSVTIGNSVTSIGYFAFAGCYSLTDLYSLNPIPPTDGMGSFTNDQYLDLNVYVPQGALSAYQEADTWKNFRNLQEFDPTGVESIKSDGKNATGVYYDIQGRRLDAPKKGLNIINGKKVLMRK